MTVAYQHSTATWNGEKWTNTIGKAIKLHTMTKKGESATINQITYLQKTINSCFTCHQHHCWHYSHWHDQLHLYTTNNPKKFAKTTDDTITSTKQPLTWSWPRTPTPKMPTPRSLSPPLSLPSPQWPLLPPPSPSWQLPPSPSPTQRSSKQPSRSFKSQSLPQLLPALPPPLPPQQLTPPRPTKQLNIQLDYRNDRCQPFFLVLLVQTDSCLIYIKDYFFHY